MSDVDDVADGSGGLTGLARPEDVGRPDEPRPRPGTTPE
jgi:hypothetical protein